MWFEVLNILCFVHMIVYHHSAQSLPDNPFEASLRTSQTFYVPRILERFVDRECTFQATAAIREDYGPKVALVARLPFGYIFKPGTFQASYQFKEFFDWNKETHRGRYVVAIYFSRGVLLFYLGIIGLYVEAVAAFIYMLT